MKTYDIKLRGFKVKAKSKVKARIEAEGILKRCAFKPVIKAIGKGRYSI